MNESSRSPGETESVREGVIAMPQRAVIIVCLITLIGGKAYGQDRQFDAGLLFGEPTGLSFKLWDEDFSMLTSLTGGRQEAAKIRKLVNAGYSIIDAIGVESDEVDAIHRYLNRGYSAYAGAIAWSIFDLSAFHLHLDYLWHQFNLFRVEEGELNLFYGLGARFKVTRHDERLGIRFPAGLDYLIPETEFDVFLEIVPVLDLTPEIKPVMNAAIGIRYVIGYMNFKRR